MADTENSTEFPAPGDAGTQPSTVQFASGGNPENQERAAVAPPEVGEQRTDLTEYEKLMRQWLDGRS